jgi:hypothetical protein
VLCAISGTMQRVFSLKPSHWCVAPWALRGRAFYEGDRWSDIRIDITFFRFLLFGCEAGIRRMNRRRLPTTDYISVD